MAIKVPAKKAIVTGKNVRSDYAECHYEAVHAGEGVAIIALGSFFGLGNEVYEALKAKGLNPTLINPLYINELDTDTLDGICKNHSLVITLEDGVLEGGFGEKIARYLGSADIKVKCYGLKKEFPIHYTLDNILRENGLTCEQIVQDVLNLK